VTETCQPAGTMNVLPSVSAHGVSLLKLFVVAERGAGAVATAG